MNYNYSQNKQIKVNEDLLSGKLKYFYKQKLSEAISDTKPQEQLSVEKGVINQVPSLLSNIAPPEVQRRIQLDQLPPNGIQDMGNGWWKVNGEWWYCAPPWKPVGINEHGLPIFSDHDGAEPDPTEPKDRYDQFPKNPTNGQITRIQGKDGNYYYYQYFLPPGAWMLVNDPSGRPNEYDDNANEQWPGYQTVPPLPPLNPLQPTNYDIIPFGPGVGNGNVPMWFDNPNWPAGIPYPGDPNPTTLPPWPSDQNNPWDPVLPPPPRPQQFWPWYPYYPQWGYPEPFGPVWTSPSLSPRPRR